MKPRIWRGISKAVFALFLFFPSFAMAHAEVFADVKVNASFDKYGFIGVQNIWSFDEVYSREVVSEIDRDGNGIFSKKELADLEKMVLGTFESEACFNLVLWGSKFLGAEEIKNFSARIENRRLVLDFLVAYPVIPATTEYSMLVITVWDPLNNILMTVNMDDSGVKNDSLDVEFFSDKLEGLTLFRGFSAGAEGLYVRFKKK